MSVLKIALLQLVSCGNNQEFNLLKGERYCRKASNMRADIVLFPEMWNIGYLGYNPKSDESRELWIKQAINIDDSFINLYKNLAKELDIAIAITYLEKTESLPKNTVTLIDRFGNIVLNYSKVHLCSFDYMEATCTPGNDFYVCELDTKIGKINIGTMICYDREFPESARILMLKGAEIIIIPNACEIDEIRMNQLQSRAFENMVGVAMTNYASSHCNGHSAAFNPDGSTILKAGEKENIYIAEFDIDKLREWRYTETWGNAFRRPSYYSILTSKEVSEPFIRKDIFGKELKR